MGILISLTILGAFLFLVWYCVQAKLMIIRVDGASMHPTLKDKRIYLAKQKFTLKPGRIYIYYNPKGIPVIKRLKFINDNNGLCYFLGDNPMASVDSRHYGFVNKEFIIAQLIWF